MFFHSQIARMYQRDDPSLLCQELSTLKGKNTTLGSTLDALKSELKDIQESKVALEAMVKMQEGEVDVSL